jgi:hypothetical protein
MGPKLLPLPRPIEPRRLGSPLERMSQPFEGLYRISDKTQHAGLGPRFEPHQWLADGRQADLAYGGGQSGELQFWNLPEEQDCQVQIINACEAGLDRRPRGRQVLGHERFWPERKEQAAPRRTGTHQASAPSGSLDDHL